MELRNSPLLRRLIFSSGIRLTGMLISIVAGLFILPYMLTKLGPNDCGLMSIVMAIISLLSFLEAGLNSAICRHIAVAIGLKDDNALCKYVNSALFLYTCVASAVFLLACLIAWNLETFIFVSRWIMSWFNEDLVSGTWGNMDAALKRNIALTRIILVLSALSFAVMLIPRIQVGVISGSLRDDILSTINLTFKVLRPLITLSVLFFGGNVIALSASSVILGCTFIPVWQFFVRQLAPQLRLSFRFIHWETIKELYKFSFFAFAAFVSSNAIISFSFLFITVILGLESVAVYNMVCLTLFCLGKDVIVTLTNYLSPIFAQLGALKQTDTMHKTLFFSLKFSTGIILFVAFGFIAWGHPFISRWMSGHPEMLAAYPPLVLMSLILLLEQSQAPTVEFLYGTGTHKYYALINTVEAGIAVVLLPVFTFQFQLVGVAAALLIASVFVRIILQPYYVCKVLKMPRWNYYSKFLLIFCRGTAALILPAAATYFLVGPSFPRLFLTGGVCAVLYAAVYVPLVFTQDERQLVWNAVRKRK